jgi:ATP-dependent exoDNAse (exonuclease V) beta subunit
MLVQYEVPAFVGQLCESCPGVRKNEYLGTDADYRDEQRRLFYVSITRPRQTLVLSRPTKIKPGDSKRLNLSVKRARAHYCELEICPFLRDIMSELPAGSLSSIQNHDEATSTSSGSETKASKSPTIFEVPAFSPRESTYFYEAEW